MATRVTARQDRNVDVLPTEKRSQCKRQHRTRKSKNQMIFYFIQIVIIAIETCVQMVSGISLSNLTLNVLDHSLRELSLGIMNRRSVNTIVIRAIGIAAIHHALIGAERIVVDFHPHVAGSGHG